MSALAKAITRATRRRPDRYDLRLDFENELYSVAHHDKDSLDLNFLAGKFLAEQDAGAGAFDLTGLVTWTRTDSAYYRDPADGLLKLAGADVPRIHSLPPRVLSAASDDMSSYADSAAYTAAGATVAAQAVFDAVNDEVDIDNQSGGQVAISGPQMTVPAGALVRVGAVIEDFVATGAGDVQGRAEDNFSRGPDLSADGIAWSRYYAAPDGDVRGRLIIDDGVTCRLTSWLVQVISHLDGERVGVLVEPERENLVSTWNRAPSGNGTATTNVATGIDGATTAGTWVPLNDGNNRNNGNVLRASTTAAQQFTYTTWLAAKELRYGAACITGNGGTRCVRVDLWTGEVVSVYDYASPVNASHTVKYFGGGIYEITISLEAEPNRSIVDFTVGATDNPDAGWPYRQTSYVADGTSGIYFMGFQVEKGYGETSLIKSAGSALTRSRDLVDFDLEALGVYQGGAPFSLVVDMQQPGGETTSNVYQLSLYENATNENALFLYRNNSVFRDSVNGPPRSTLAAGLDWDDKDRHRLALAVLGSGEVRYSVDGAGVESGGAGTTPSPPKVDTLRLGASPSNPNYTASAMFYGVRLMRGALSDAELVEEAA